MDVDRALIIINKEIDFIYQNKSSFISFFADGHEDLVRICFGYNCVEFEAYCSQTLNSFIERIEIEDYKKWKNMLT